MGIGKIDGRPVAVGGEDYTIRAGNGFGSDRRKAARAASSKTGVRISIPLVNLIDGTGGTVNTAKRKGYTVVPGYDRTAASARPSARYRARRLGGDGHDGGRAFDARDTVDWSVMVKGTGQIFAAVLRG